MSDILGVAKLSRTPDGIWRFCYYEGITEETVEKVRTFGAGNTFLEVCLILTRMGWKPIGPTIPVEFNEYLFVKEINDQ